LAVLPAAIGVAAASWWSLAAAIGVIVAAAESGRRRGGGVRVFPAVTALAAPVWVGERAICAWLAVAAYTIWGGMPYRGRIIARPATPLRRIQQRLNGG
jgi:hypothetical protein